MQSKPTQAIVSPGKRHRTQPKHDLTYLRVQETGISQIVKGPNEMNQDQREQCILQCIRLSQLAFSVSVLQNSIQVSVNVTFLVAVN